jgi:hypothetical protein
MTTPVAPPSSAAHDARSIADQDERRLGGPRSLLVPQRRDHADLDRLLDALIAQPQAEAPLNRLARLVFPDAYAEETVVWPDLREALPDGEQLALRNEQEHQQINALWTGLERDRRPDMEGSSSYRTHPSTSRRVAPTTGQPAVCAASRLPRPQPRRSGGRCPAPLLSPALTAASRALASVAGAVEDLPSLSLGERAETRA